LSIGVKCGTFSYAEILRKFELIMGVTGTLQTLSVMEKNIIRDYYDIQIHTYAPSAFGDSKFHVDKDKYIQIKTIDDFYNAIIKEIDDKLVGNTPGCKRAVLVFFETKKDLLKFNDEKRLNQMYDNF
jgi:hypothetical protein